MASSDADPWDWSIDAVVAHLCEDPGPLFPRYESVINKADLESAVRKNHLTGDCLLQMTDTQIERCLLISAVGPQIHCRNSIQQLQHKSTKWMDHVSQHFMLQSAHLAQLFDRFVASVSVPVGTASILSPYRNVDQSTPRTEPKRITPALITDQVDHEPPNERAETTDHVISQADCEIPVASLDHQTLSTSAQDHEQDRLPSLKALVGSTKLPRVPEHLFSRPNPQIIHNEVAGKFKKGENKTEKTMDTDQPLSRTAGYQLLKEIESTQLSRWQATKLPLLELEAHQLWIDATDKRLMQNYCQQWIKKLQHRLQKLETEILNSASSRDMKRMAEILQPTVMDIAIWQWKLKLYRQTKQPEKSLSQAITKPKKRRISELETEIDLSSEESDDIIDNDQTGHGGDTEDLDDFIDYDEEDYGGEYEGDYEDSHGDEQEISHKEDDMKEVSGKSQAIQLAHRSLTKPRARVGNSARSSKNTIAIPRLKIENPPDNRLALVYRNPLRTGAKPNEEPILILDSPLPPYWDLDTLKKMDFGWAIRLIAARRHEHLLAWNITRNLAVWRKVSLFIMAQSNSNSPWSSLGHYLRCLFYPERLAIQAVKSGNVNSFDASIQIAVWFTLWICMETIKMEGLSKTQITWALKSHEDNSGRGSFTKFWETLQVIKCHWALSQINPNLPEIGPHQDSLA